MMHWVGQRVLVTGISGFLGSSVAARLIKLGAEVYGVSRSPQRTDLGHLLVGDLTNSNFVDQIFREARPNIVLHLAGQTNTSIDKSWILPTFQGNVETTVNLLAAATKVHCSRIILTGSLEEPETDGSDIVPTSPYALSKWETVRYGRAFHAMYHLPVVIVRPFMTYGPRQRPTKLVPYSALSLLQGRIPVIKSAERCVDWVFIDDVVEGMLAAAVATGVEGQTIDLGTGIATSVRQVVTELVCVTGAMIDPRFEQAVGVTAVNNRIADITKAALWLKWKPTTSLRDGLIQTVEWYKSYLLAAGSIERSW